MRTTLLALSLLPTLTYADFLTDFKTRLHSLPQARSSSQASGGAAILVFSTRDTKSYRPPLKSKIIAISLSYSGDSVGYVLKHNGVPFCTFSGFFDGQCLTVSGCLSGTVCD